MPFFALSIFRLKGYLKFTAEGILKKGHLKRPITLT
jgi:hypothetical protein